MPLSPWCVLVFGGRLFTDCSQRFGNRDVHFCQGSPAPRGPLLGGRVLVRTLGGYCVSDCRAAGQFECGALVSPDRQNPRRVAVMMHVLNMDALNAVMQSPAAAEAMAHDGHPGTEASRSTGLVQQAVAVEPALIDVT